MADGDRWREIAAEALAAVHLTPAGRYLPRSPHQLSGGERQWVAFARALVTRPRLILADEPTQMLDVSLRAEIANLLDEPRAVRGVAVLHITRDLVLAQRSCDRLGGAASWSGGGARADRRAAVSTGHPYTAAPVEAARALSAPRR